MRRLEGLLRFIWDFVVGDDWRIAVAVVVALVLTTTLEGIIAAWWVLPVAVASVLGLSVWRAAAAARR